MALATKLCGIELSNPTVLSSGVLGTSGSILKRVAKEGAGAVTTKTLGLEPRTGWKSPIIAGFEGGLINAVGLANPGCKSFRKQFRVAKEGGSPVIASIFGSDAKDFSKLAEEVASHGADLIELNVSCPNTEKCMIGRDPGLVYQIVSSVKNKVSIPVLTKLSPNVDDIVQIAKSAEEGGSDGLSMINTVGPGMIIDIETAKPVLEFKRGGMCGSAVRPIAVRCIYDVYENVDIPILGVGGVSTGEHAIELIMAGARAVGIGTAVMTHGLGIFKEVCKGIEIFMKKEGYEKIGDMVGIAHK